MSKKQITNKLVLPENKQQQNNNSKVCSNVNLWIKGIPEFEKVTYRHIE